MKLTHSQETSFAPVTITLRCESQAEVNAIAGVFNSAIVMDALRTAYGVNMQPYKDIETLHTTQGIFDFNNRLRNRA